RIGMAGEQIKGFSTSVSVPRTQSQTRITQAEVAQSLQMVQRRALREAVRQMSQEMGVPEVNVKLVHSAITGIRVDGYPVSNPLNFQGRSLDLTIFNTFAPLTHIGALQTIAQELDLELFATLADPYAMARAPAPRCSPRAWRSRSRTWPAARRSRPRSTSPAAARRSPRSPTSCARSTGPSTSPSPRRRRSRCSAPRR